MKKWSSYLNYVLLFILLGVGIYTSINTKDPVLMFFVMVLFGTGWSFTQANDAFGQSIEKMKEALQKYERR